MVHNVALVLGGGGAAGNAWQIGAIAGLAEAGLDLTDAADLVIGTSAAELQRAMGAFGLESDPALGPAARQQRRAMVAARLPRPQWPDRPMIVVAIDARTGDLVAFDRDSGVDLVDAVTASTALPGLVPTHSINGAQRRR
jgi:NTE family protein